MSRVSAWVLSPSAPYYFRLKISILSIFVVFVLLRALRSSGIVSSIICSKLKSSGCRSAISIAVGRFFPFLSTSPKTNTQYLLGFKTQWSCFKQIDICSR